jgi:hypothetical protein
MCRISAYAFSIAHALSSCRRSRWLVAGVIGADLSPGVIPVPAGANLIADGFAMAAANYAAARAEQAYVIGAWLRGLTG